MDKKEIEQSLAKIQQNLFSMEGMLHMNFMSLIKAINDLTAAVKEGKK